MRLTEAEVMKLIICLADSLKADSRGLIRFTYGLERRKDLLIKIMERHDFVVEEITESVESVRKIRTQE